MEPFYLLNFSWIVALLSLFLTGVVSSSRKGLVAAIAVIVNSILTTLPAFAALGGTPTDIVLTAGSFLGEIPIRIDALSAWFILIINLTSLSGAIYGIGYLKPYPSTKGKEALHWSMFILFHLSMVWVVILQNGLAFLVAWEIMSLSSMMLVIFDGNKPKTLKAGINYMVQMHISVVFLTIGFIWVYAETGSFSFDALSTYFTSNGNLWLFLVFFVGFGIKAGFIPLHSWLPHAHPAAPSHVSGVMSGVIVKLGIYGIIRVIAHLKADYILLGEIVLTISVLTGLFGILNAAVHRDFKRMLAYCTIENIGIIGIGIGLGLIGLGNDSATLTALGFAGALLHVLNHSLFKSLLFYSAGSVYQQTHTRDMDKLGGLIRTMPQTAILFLIGSVAIAGIPPFNGFISEFILYNGLLEGLKSDDLGLVSLVVLSFAGLSLIGGLSLLAFSKTFATLFLGSARTQLKHPSHEVSKTMLVPQYFIVAVMLGISFFPQYFIKPIGLAIENIILLQITSKPVLLETLTGNLAHINLYFFLLIALSALIMALRWLALKPKPQALGATWGCGYGAPNSRLQYTGKSFSKPLSKIFSFIVIEEKKYKELKPGEIFPRSRKYSSHYHDFFEKRIIGFVTQRLVFGANYFKFIQNGRVQSYVLYGIIFVMAIILLTVFNVVK